MVGRSGHKRRLFGWMRCVLSCWPTEVAEVARAARDVGVRVGFAVAMRNRNPLVYGPSEPVLASHHEVVTA